MARPTIGGAEVVAGFKVETPTGEVVALLIQGPILAIFTEPDRVIMQLPDGISRATLISKGVTIHPGPTGLIGGLVAGLANLAMRDRPGAQGSVRIWPKVGGEWVLRGEPTQVEILMAAFKQYGVPCD